MRKWSSVTSRASTSSSTEDSFEVESLSSNLNLNFPATKSSSASMENQPEPPRRRHPSTPSFLSTANLRRFSKDSPNARKLSAPIETSRVLFAGGLLVDRLEHSIKKVVRRPGNRGPAFERDGLRRAISQRQLNINPKFMCLKKVDKVQLVDKFAPAKQAPAVGTLYITTTHVIYKCDTSNNEIWVLHNQIGSVERGPISVKGCTLTVRAKYFLTLNFVFNRDKECQDVYESLTMLSQPVNIEDVYAFYYVPSSKQLAGSSGWDYDIRDDYQRMGLPNKQWALSDFNADYQYCDTYPEHLVVPSSTSKQTLIGSLNFRSRGRLPVLSYYHRKSNASICRCSQPLAGFSARCMEDEALMEQIRKTNPDRNVLFLIDTRPKLNAMFNKAAGKGFENEKHYVNARLHYFNIENIHVMRGSLQKLVDVSHKPCNMNALLAGIESSGWLKHIRLILEASRFIADSVSKGVSCVVHCSDGWDRTAQTVALACLLLDPFYRTFRGFSRLIEKDWLAFGHKFSDRCGHTGGSDKQSGGDNDSNNSYTAKLQAAASGQSAAKEVSPVFTQFLDCVWQLTEQWPLSFEFNELYLIELHAHAHGCQFGTFLGNCEKDRRDLRLSSRTHSVWAHMDANRAEYVNAFYESPGASDPDVLQPDVRIQSIKFWRSLYNRHNYGLHAREPLKQTAVHDLQHLRLLSSHAHVLQQRINVAKQRGTAALVDSGVSSSSGDDVREMSKKLQSAALSPTSNNNNNNNGTSAAADNAARLAVQWTSTRDTDACANCAHTFVHKQTQWHCCVCGQVLCSACAQRLGPTNLSSETPLLSASYYETSSGAQSCPAVLCPTCLTQLDKRQAQAVTPETLPATVGCGASGGAGVASKLLRSDSTVTTQSDPLMVNS